MQDNRTAAPLVEHPEGVDANVAQPEASQRRISAELLSSLIRGEPPAGGWLDRAHHREALLDTADRHGVTLLIAHRLRRQAKDDQRISQLAELFSQHQRSDAAIGLVTEKELAETLDALAGNGVTPLLIKGAPLSYSHYPTPVMRPRADTDILIPANRKSETKTTLLERGYRARDAAGGRLMTYQLNFEKRDALHVDHTLDVHWRLSNHQAFARLFSFGELAETAVPVPELGGNARGLGPVHALLLACMHRVAHLHTPLYIDGAPQLCGDRLIWLYDIHLLVTGMSADQLDSFAALATEKRIGRICLDGIERAGHYFGTRPPAALITAISANRRPEPSARYLVPGRLRYLVTELHALPGWRFRYRYLKDLAFPGSAFLLRQYGVINRMWLPVLYVHRGVRGVWKLARNALRSGKSAGASPLTKDRAVY